MIREPLLDEAECKITHEQPKISQKIKLNKYKEIAKKVEVTRKLRFE